MVASPSCFAIFARRKSKTIARKRRSLQGTETLEARCMLSTTPLGSIAGAVFADTNSNGVLDAEEIGLANVAVSLTGVDEFGDPVELSQTTDDIGRYAFENLRAGVYEITESQPDGYFDGDEQLGSSGGTTGEDQFTLKLATGELATGYYFGELPPASLGGYVYLDKDRDGNYDAFDEILSDIQVKLSGKDDLGNKVKASVTTGADGSYEFAGLRPGTYDVRANQAKGYADGRDTLGTFVGNARPIGRNGIMKNDRFASIELRAGERGYNYNFGELDEAFVAGTLATTFETTVAFEGTPEVDQFEFIAGVTEHTVVLNGETFTVDASQTTLVTFHGQSGDDVVQLIGLSSKDEVEFRATSAKFTGVSYQVRVYSSPRITALSGGGEDRAMFYDTGGDERFEADPLEGRMTGDGFEHSAHSFHRVYAYASAGTDVAILARFRGERCLQSDPDRCPHVWQWLLQLHPRL